jgi:hypothetical protein
LGNSLALVFQYAPRQKDRSTAEVALKKRRVVQYAYQHFKKVHPFAFPAKALVGIAITRSASYHGLFNMMNVHTAVADILIFQNFL